MRATENFLRLIWPSAGEKAIVSIQHGQVRHHWFHHDQVVEASDKAHELSLAGLDVYMGVGGFNAHTRKAAHAVAFKTLFLDLDCGEGKQYTDQEAAKTALGAFVATLKLPTPLVVSSGYGLHIYWPLNTELPTQEWLILATALKNLCLQHNFKADDGCTADAARILRPLGTFNYKNGAPRRVAALTGASICITKDLKQSLLSQAVNVFKDLHRRQVGAAKVADTAFNSQEPVEFDDILPRCATARWAYENQNEVREPLWYAMLGLVNYCKSPSESAHRISSGHAQYNRTDTESKLAQWANHASGPTTCAAFRGTEGNQCVGCHERVTSPIQLGQPKGIRPVVSALTVFGHKYYTDSWIKINTDGMHIKHQPPPNKDGSSPPPEWTKITDYGLQPLLNLRLTDGSGIPSNYLWMEAHDSNMNPRTNFVLPAVNINTSPLLAADCARNGIINEIETSPAAFRAFSKIMRNWVRKLEQQQGSVLTFRSFGWIGPDGSQDQRSFFLGTKLYTPDNILPVPTLPQLENYQNAMRTRGTLEAWTQAMDGYNLPGMEPYMFASWTAWGAPLMSFTNSGNLVFSLVGDTGVGKSSVQKSIISVYGDYDSRILLDRPDSTINSVNGGMGYLNSLPYCRDEAAEGDPAEIASWVLTMTEGREKGRMTQNLSIAHVKTWSTIAIISSNTSVREIVVSQRPDNAARLARIWEQNIVTPISQSLATQIFSPLRTNYGHAGPIYIDYCAKNYDRNKNVLIDTETRLMKRLRAGGAGSVLHQPYGCLLHWRAHCRRPWTDSPRSESRHGLRLGPIQTTAPECEG